MSIRGVNTKTFFELNLLSLKSQLLQTHPSLIELTSRKSPSSYLLPSAGSSEQPSILLSAELRNLLSVEIT
jgi:hypothetical protein